MRRLFRHEVVFVLGENPFNDFRCLGLAWDDGNLPTLARLQGEFADVETEVSLTRLRVEAVAVETGVRHDRTDVAVEVDGVIGLVGGEQGGQAEDGNGDQTKGTQVRGHG